MAVMLSTIGTLETSFLSFTRTMYAKARGGALHRRYARLHRTWQTPWIATAVLTVLGLALLFLSSLLPTVNQIMKDSVNAIGFQVAFYTGWRVSPALGTRAGRPSGARQRWSRSCSGR